MPKYFETFPVCPALGDNGLPNTYTNAAIIPPIGTLYSGCSPNTKH